MRLRMSVVFPEPKKPVIIVIGMGWEAAMVAQDRAEEKLQGAGVTAALLRHGSNEKSDFLSICHRPPPNAQVPGGDRRCRNSPISGDMRAVSQQVRQPDERALQVGKEWGTLVVGPATHTQPPGGLCRATRAEQDRTIPAWLRHNTSTALSSRRLHLSPCKRLLGSHANGVRERSLDPSEGRLSNVRGKAVST